MSINLKNTLIVGVMAIVFIVGLKMLVGGTVLGKIPGLKAVTDLA
jgi:hypothetical protein